jgi:hypothetical protein
MTDPLAKKLSILSALWVEHNLLTVRQQQSIDLGAVCASRLHVAFGDPVCKPFIRAFHVLRYLQEIRQALEMPSGQSAQAAPRPVAPATETAQQPSSDRLRRISQLCLIALRVAQSHGSFSLAKSEPFLLANLSDLRQCSCTASCCKGHADFVGFFLFDEAYEVHRKYCPALAPIVAPVPKTDAIMVKVSPSLLRTDRRVIAHLWYRWRRTGTYELASTEFKSWLGGDSSLAARSRFNRFALAWQQFEKMTASIDRAIECRRGVARELDRELKLGRQTRSQEVLRAVHCVEDHLADLDDSISRGYSTLDAAVEFGYFDLPLPENPCNYAQRACTRPNCRDHCGFLRLFVYLDLQHDHANNRPLNVIEEAN